jgi:hypothetical protein
MDKRILDKIKKLMNLASSSNEHEAANALRMAQKLMQEHQVDQVDVELSDIAMQSADDVNSAGKPPAWSVQLIATITTAFGLSAVRASTLWGGPKIQFIGPADRCEIGTYCYTVLGRLLLRARAEYLAGLSKRLKRSSKTNRLNLFSEGWIQAVHSKLHRLVPNEKEQQLIAVFKERTFGTLNNLQGRASKEKARDQEAYYDGKAQGRNVQLNAGVTGASQGRIGRNTEF